MILLRSRKFSISYVFSHAGAGWGKKAGLFLISMILIWCSSITESSGQDTAEQFIVSMNEQIPRWMNRYSVPGVSIALIRQSEVVWLNSYGYADLEQGRQMTSDTVCRVESISKSVTARGVMKLVEQGKISLDDPVHEYLESWEFPGSESESERVTIRQLLSHYSGLPLGTIGLEYDPQEDKPSLRESLTREMNFVQDPGRSFIYSNVGFNLLELLIEDVSGRSFSDFMEDEILLPLGMQNSSFEWRENFITMVPNGHKLNGESVPVYLYSEKAAGGLFANVEDMARFVSSGMAGPFYSENNVLTESSLRKLYTPVTDVKDIYSLVADNYGLGHFIEILPNGKVAVFVGGQGNGWMTHFHMIPDSGDGIVILTNSSRSWPLISHILGEWTASIGYGPVGMEIITKAISALWILTGLMMVLACFQIARITFQYFRGARRFDFHLINYSPAQFLQLALFVILLSVLIWSVTRDYLIITSVFPGVSGWLIFTLFLIAMALLITALFQKNQSRET